MSARTPIRVLIAEDDATVREALADLVGSEPGLTLVATVAGAASAVEAAAREHPDVALVDVRMPGGGPNATRGIKRRSPQTKVLALSAHEDRATVLSMLEAGAVGYLVKGGSIASIVESIEHAAAGRGSLSGEVTGDVIDALTGQLTLHRRGEQRRRSREVRIRRAIDDEGAFGVVFQPVCTLDGDVVGTEALARFSGQPQRGPDRWFAEADEVGLRLDLELAAVRKAFDELDQLPADVFLCVNVSPTTLTSAAFRRLVAGTDGARIVVEVTEYAPIDDYAKTNRALERLRSLGVRLAIDDAGAGFASLRHILQLAPEFIKLDRSLIAGIDRDRSQQALAAGLISFADTIGATIVAEGVERPEQVEALRSLGVRFGQGFLLGRPAPLPVAV